MCWQKGHNYDGFWAKETEAIVNTDWFLESKFENYLIFNSKGSCSWMKDFGVLFTNQLFNRKVIWKAISLLPFSEVSFKCEIVPNNHKVQFKSGIEKPFWVNQVQVWQLEKGRKSMYPSLMAPMAATDLVSYFPKSYQYCTECAQTCISSNNTFYNLIKRHLWLGL